MSNLPSGADFPSIKDELTDTEDEDDSTLSEDSRKQREKNASELELLMPQHDFRELFNRFFILRHQELLMLQTTIRQEREPGSTSGVPSLRDLDNLQLNTLRNQYYRLQMLLFNMSKGGNHSSTL
ncbi:hypothetical protein SAMN05443144_12051 [Fodinibius roseus]|uniref:Uncharacterized protein n=1 Tax=Fodinibius roseus TaxID=1194090 RepID=A0A1M5HIC7_9BACT|nr:hypothetical protein [Fodinibius roseus]SHG15685.1 hypothetical protein SAMN05443144_12051 [Fodinibius roseus]